MRTSRRAPRLNHDLILEPRDLEILKLFRTYRLLPTNIIHALVGGSYYTVQRRLTKLASGVYSLKTDKLVMSGLLDRFTFNGTTNNNAVMVYSLSERGDQKLTELGFPPVDEYDRSHNAHQALLDLLDAGIELGTTENRLIRWPAIVAHPRTPKMPPKPFRFDGLVPDGRPFVLANPERSILFLKELDRSSEGHKQLLAKLELYKKHQEDIKARYGVRSLMLLIVTTNEARRQNVLVDIQRVFPKGCEWILTHVLDDYTIFGRRPELPTHLVDVPWQRAGKPPFSLKTLTESLGLAQK